MIPADHKAVHAPPSRTLIVETLEGLTSTSRGLRTRSARELQAGAARGADGAKLTGHARRPEIPSSPRMTRIPIPAPRVGLLGVARLVSHDAVVWIVLDAVLIVASKSRCRRLPAS